MYILIAVIFIAELIIALQLILLIEKADKKVCDLNECVAAFNPLAKTCLEYVRCLSSVFNKNVIKSIEFIKKQHYKMIIKTISAVAIYGMLVFFKIRRVKAKKIYNLIGAIRDVALEIAI